MKAYHFSLLFWEKTQNFEISPIRYFSDFNFFSGTYMIAFNKWGIRWKLMITSINFSQIDSEKNLNKDEFEKIRTYARIFIKLCQGARGKFTKCLCNTADPSLFCVKHSLSSGYPSVILYTFVSCNAIRTIHKDSPVLYIHAFHPCFSQLKQPSIARLFHSIQPSDVRPASSSSALHIHCLQVFSFVGTGLSILPQ